ncbi:hypothetical protein Tco_0638183 [Tanacetum coccineum]
MSSMPSIVYLVAGVLVMEEEYVPSLFPAFKYSRSLLKKNSTGIVPLSRLNIGPTISALVILFNLRRFMENA